MNKITTATSLVLVSGVFALASCSMQEEKSTTPAATPAAPVAQPQAKAAPVEKAPAKVKAQKARGDIGLLDTEKNYLILVTKEGKLLTLDFDNKTKVMQITPTPGKIADIGLGSSATVTYSEDKGKNVATNVEFKAAKGGD